MLAVLGLSIDSSLLSVAIHQSKPEACVLAAKASVFPETDAEIYGHLGRSAKLIIMLAYINAHITPVWIFLIS